MAYGRMYTFLEWGKKVKGYAMSDPLQEMDAPMATPTNTPGMGNSVPASIDSDGTADIFSGDGKKKKKINEDKALPKGTYIDDDPESKYGFTVGRREYGNGPGSDFARKLAAEIDGDDKVFNEKYLKRFTWKMNEGQVVKHKFMYIEEIKPGLYDVEMKMSPFPGAPDTEEAEDLMNNQKPKKLFPEIMHGIFRINPKYGKATNVVIEGHKKLPHNVNSIKFQVKIKFS